MSTQDGQQIDTRFPSFPTSLGHRRFAGMTLGWLLIAWVLSTYRSACVILRKKTVKEEKKKEEERKKKEEERKKKEKKEREDKARKAKETKAAKEQTKKKKNNAKQMNTIGEEEELVEMEEEKQEKIKEEKESESLSVVLDVAPGTSENEGRSAPAGSATCCGRGKRGEETRWSRFCLVLEYAFTFPAMSLFGPAW